MERRESKKIEDWIGRRGERGARGEGRREREKKEGWRERTGERGRSFDAPPNFPLGHLTLSRFLLCPSSSGQTLSPGTCPQTTTCSLIQLNGSDFVCFSPEKQDQDLGAACLSSHSRLYTYSTKNDEGSLWSCETVRRSCHIRPSTNTPSASARGFLRS